MAVMSGRLYAALREANVPEGAATAAADEAASFESAMTVALVGKIFLAR